jgi:transcriptional regulator with XRE-family HTH domain
MTKVKEMATGKEIKRLRGGETSAAKVASLIGVGVDRLRKWEERDVDPSDTADIEKVEAYFGCALSQLKNIKDFEFVKRPSTRVEPKEMPDIAGIQKSINEMTLTILSQVRSQQQSSERLMSLEVRLQEIEKRLTDLANLFQSGKNGDPVPKKTEVRVTRS